MQRTLCLLALASWLVAGPLSAADSIPAASRVLDAEQQPDDIRLKEPRRLEDAYHPWVPPADLESWQKAASAIRERMLVSNGLWPMLPKIDLKPVIHGKVDRDDYTVEKVFFASLPGHYVTGNLYRPKKVVGKTAGVLCPHGHWANGRFYDAGEAGAKEQMSLGAEKFMSGAQYPLQARMVHLARLGCVVFHYDMIGYADNKPLDHRQGFNDVDAELRLQNLMGLQTFNSIRALDFLLSLPEVDAQRIGVTGASGGGTQTFMLCGVDPRPAAAFPAVMVSTSMQGGCVCENASCLRIGVNNVALTALFAPKPLAMSGADDWTREIETKGFPELRQIYSLYGKPDLVAARAFPQFKHNYNQVAREMMYAWFAQHLGLDPTRGLEEREFDPIPPAELSVFNAEHPQPKDMVDAPRLREYLKRTTIEQYNQLRPRDAQSLADYRRIVGPAARVILDPGVPVTEDVELRERGDVVLEDGVLFRRLTFSRRGAWEQVPMLVLIPVGATGTSVLWVDGQGKGALYDSEGKLIPQVRKLLAAKVIVAAIDPFLTGEYLQNGQSPQITVNAKFSGYTFGYNRSVLAQRVHDILTGVAALKRQPGVREVRLIGTGDAGPWALLARALATQEIERAVADLRSFSFERIPEMTDPMMLPGALRYGGIGGLAAIGAPAPLMLAGVKDAVATELQPLTAAYEAAGAKVQYQREPLTADQAVEYVLK